MHPLTLKLNATGKRLLIRFTRVPATLELTLGDRTPAAVITRKLTLAR